MNHGEKTAIELPAPLSRQLSELKDQLRKTKTLESLLAFGLATIVLTLSLFVIDRGFETPKFVRTLIALALLVSVAVTSVYALRWLLSIQTLRDISKWIRQEDPDLGDSLLGAIELSSSNDEQRRSPTLCRAAIEQVATRTAAIDLKQRIDTRPLRILTVAFYVVAIPFVLGSIVLPAALTSTSFRIVAPWSEIPRFTFTRIADFPATEFVPYGEATSIHIGAVDSSSWWKAKTGEASLVSSSLASSDRSNAAGNGILRISIATANDGQTLNIDLPPVTERKSLSVAIGDFRGKVVVEPIQRPEVVEMSADIAFPDYLQLKEKTTHKDIRTQVVRLIEGSAATFQLRFNRHIENITATCRNDAPLQASAAQPTGVVTPNHAAVPSTEVLAELPVAVSGDRANVRVEGYQAQLDESSANRWIDWTFEDAHGLKNRNPLSIEYRWMADPAPTVAIMGIPTQKICLNSEQIDFAVVANDDFGVQQVGLKYKAIDSTNVEREMILQNGAPETQSLESRAFFSAKDFGIESGVIELSAWAIDYKPNRKPSISVPIKLFVLTPEDHAIWITQQFDLWNRQALEVRDCEVDLHLYNQELSKQLESIDPNSKDEFDSLLARLRDQSQLESANASKLDALVRASEQLLRQAKNNDQIGVGHLERWATQTSALQDFAQSRMPKIAKLLQSASQKSKAASSTASNSNSRLGSSATNDSSNTDSSVEQTALEKEEDSSKNANSPSIASLESTMEKSESSQSSANEKKTEPSASPPRIGLAATTLTGPSSNKKAENEEGPPDSESKTLTDEAIKEQDALLAEFESMVDEMNAVLGELESSTFVKRLKSASRKQVEIAKTVRSLLPSVYSSSTASQSGRIAAALDDVQTATIDHPTQEKQATDGATAKQLHSSEIESVLVESSERTKKSSTELSNLIDDMESFSQRKKDEGLLDVLTDIKSQQPMQAMNDIAVEVSRVPGLSIAQHEYWADTLDRWAEDLVGPACEGKCPGSKSATSLPPSVVLAALKILQGEVDLREQTRVAEQAKSGRSEADVAVESTRLAEKQTALNADSNAVLKLILDLPDARQNFEKEIAMFYQVDLLMDDAQLRLSKSDTGRETNAIETEIIELMLKSKRINPKSKGSSGTTPGGGGNGDTTDSAIALMGSGIDSKGKTADRDTLQSTGRAGMILPEEYREQLDLYFQKIEDELGKK